MTPEEIHKIAAVESSHWWYVGMREICFSILQPWLAGRRPLRILDIGCGTGGNLLELREFGDARGIDISPICVDYCRQKGLRCEPGSMSELHAAAGSLDLVTLFDVLTQTDRHEASATLERIHEALVPGGLVAFREPAMEIAGGAHDRATNVRYRWSRSQVVSLLEQTGFEPLRVTYLNTLLFPPIVLFRRFLEATRPAHAESDVKPVPGPINALLLATLRIEKQLLQVTNLPFGVSLFAVGRKTARTTGATPHA